MKINYLKKGILLFQYELWRQVRIRNAFRQRKENHIVHNTEKLRISLNNNCDLRKIIMGKHEVFIFVFILNYNVLFNKTSYFNEMLENDLWISF